MRFWRLQTNLLALSIVNTRTGLMEMMTRYSLFWKLYMICISHELTIKAVTKLYVYVKEFILTCMNSYSYVRNMVLCNVMVVMFHIIGKLIYTIYTAVYCIHINNCVIPWRIRITKLCMSTWKDSYSRYEFVFFGVRIRTPRYEFVLFWNTN